MKKLFCILFLFAESTFASPQGVPVQSTFTCGLANLQMLAQNNSRGYLLFQNQGSDSTGHCHFKFGSAITGTEGLWVNQGQNYEVIEGYVKQPVYCKCDSASQTIEILETNW